MTSDAVLYRPEDAARLLEISRSKIFELIASGAIASVKIGRSRRVSRRAIDDFVARMESAGAAA